MKFCFAVGCLLLFASVDISHAQVENPVQRAVQEVVNPAPVQRVDGNVVPLFWKAEIDGTIVTVPLANIEFFGKQAYVVDGATRVRELTIATDARSLIRIYHIRPLAVTNNVSERIDDLRNVAEGRIVGEEHRPVKIFPTTTHAHMVEYRVGDQGHIDKLYEHLESVMIEYHARYLVEPQRPGTVRAIKID